MPQSKDYELYHYGVMGMKWGRRKDQGNSAVGNKKPKKVKEVSEDAAKASASQKKASSQGIQSLTNTELRELNERMNLEQNFARMAPATISKGKRITNGLGMSTQLASEAYKFYESPIGKDLRKAVVSKSPAGRNLETAAKVIKTVGQTAKIANELKKTFG